MYVDNPVILLEELLGAGKSTLGNLLIEKSHDNGPFYVSADMESVTRECSTVTMQIDGVMYNIVDTPGIFDTRQATDAILKEIAKSIHKCAHGVKAILIVFEASRFTDEQRNVLNGIRTFLGKDATNNIIAVFSHANIMQTRDRNEMQKAWNQPVRSFIQGIGNRWGISPSPDNFSPDNPIHKARLREIKELISSMQGVYTTEQLERNLQEQEKARLQREAEEKRAKQEYEERLKANARREAEAVYRRQVEQIQQEAKEAKEQHRQMIELIREEKKAQQEREENLRRKEKELEENLRRREKELEENLGKKNLRRRENEPMKSQENLGKDNQQEQNVQKQEEEKIDISVKLYRNMLDFIFPSRSSNDPSLSSLSSIFPSHSVSTLGLPSIFPSLSSCQSSIFPSHSVSTLGLPSIFPSLSSCQSSIFPSHSSYDPSLSSLSSIFPSHSLFSSPQVTKVIHNISKNMTFEELVPIIRVWFSLSWFYQLDIYDINHKYLRPETKLSAVFSSDDSYIINVVLKQPF